MHRLCIVPLLLSRMPGVILSICPYSVCIDSAQSHFSCPGCRTLHSPTSLSCMLGVILGICPHSVCMDSAQSHFSCPVCRV
ncbi:unnamed protein product [Staurois parvus]|uniref:RING-type domain-containing protein n=1 Tax=Staurois parvus TaxID=386267 RepID=A0ABN9FGD9_9NEOB|nr:unnamed protein product [Staurois parvus]